MRLSLIAAMTDQRVIGVENRLPWKLPVDMRWFRQHTLGKPVIMGRTTFDSLGRRPLPDRKNIVITRNRQFNAHDVIIVHSLEAAVGAAAGAPEAMIIGGATLYAEALPLVNRMYLTVVHADVIGDAWFPSFNSTQWRETERVETGPDEKNSYACSFLILDKI